jgi:uncharacterized protein YxeA
MKLSTNQKGAAHIAAILLIIIMIVILGIGFYVFSTNNKKDIPTTPQNTASVTQSKDVAQSKKLETYCDEIENACIDFDNNWDKKFETVTDSETNKDRKILKLTSNKYKTVVVTFNPYVYGIGGSCQEGTVTSSSEIVKAQGQKLVESYSPFQEINNSQPAGPIKYIASISVQPDKYAKVGKTDCLGIGVYDNKNYGDKKVSGSLTIRTTKESFASEKDALDWFKDEDVAAARKILLSLNLK